MNEHRNEPAPPAPGFPCCFNPLKPQVRLGSSGPTRLRSSTHRARGFESRRQEGAAASTPLRGSAPAEGYTRRGGACEGRGLMGRGQSGIPQMVPALRSVALAATGLRR